MPSQRAGQFSILEWGQLTGTSWLGSHAAFISTGKKKVEFSGRFPLLLRIGASPINPSHILLHHLRSSALTTRLHEKHSRAGCQRTRVHCWTPLPVDPVVGHSGGLCRLQLAVRRMGYMQAGPDTGSICQDLLEDDAGEHDLVPELDFQGIFVDSLQQLAVVFTHR